MNHDLLIEKKREINYLFITLIEIFSLFLELSEHLSGSDYYVHHTQHHFFVIRHEIE